MILLAILQALFFEEILSSSTFRAAVYEHAVTVPSHNNQVVVPRQTALSNMMKNLHVYQEQAVTAGQQNVDILVFPEDGIYGVGFHREELEPYLEYIPDPQDNWNPCIDPYRYPNTDVQRFLSCLARNNSLYLVANFGDHQPCSRLSDSDCPSDGHYQYNTDLAYDPSGTMIAKYHKVNLFYEFQFDFPKGSESVTFTTPFGIFGMFTCFDIIFHDPAIDLIERLGVRNIAFPTAWMDALPLLSSIQFHSAFAAGNKVNLLASNINLPSKRFHGSGIYTPNGAEKFYYNDDDPRGALLVSDIPILNQDDHFLSRPGKGNVQQTMEFERSKAARSLPGDRRHSDAVVHADGAFQSLVFHDLFNFRYLDSGNGNVSVCHRNVCCHLSYERENNSDIYALGAFDGLHTYQGSYYIQVCTMLKCNGDQPHNCGEPTKNASTRFGSIRLTGTFKGENVYPEILLTNNGSLRLPTTSEWTYDSGVLESSGFQNYPVLSISMFSRVYTDMDSNGHHAG